MKKFLLLWLIVASLNFYGQDEKKQADTTYWDKGGIITATFSATNYKYWAAGGNNSIALNGLFSGHANYKKNNISWQNAVEIAYGTQQTTGLPFRKTDDRIHLSSNFGLKTKNNFYTTALLDFKTQFTDGYKYLENNDSVRISAFMAPGYLVYSLGVNYIPSKNFSVYSSFLTGKTTFVLDTALSNQGAFGIDTGKTLRYEFGAYVKIVFNKKFSDNFSLNSTISLFSNYLKNPQNIDVNFNMLATYKFTKYLTLNLQINSIYDDDILIIIDPVTQQKGKRLQIQQVLGIGFTYNF